MPRPRSLHPATRNQDVSQALIMVRRNGDSILLSPVTEHLSSGVNTLHAPPRRLHGGESQAASRKVYACTGVLYLCNSKL